jgi:hypothetical protein
MTVDMKLDDPDHELDRLREASERVAANLVELEIDSSRQLVEASTLTGESAARWSAASAALTDLWEWRGLLERFIERADELRRSPRRSAEYRALITGESIELSSTPVPLAERDLLGSSEVTVRCTAAELLARMSRAFDGVKTVVAEIGRAWDTLTPRLAAARATLGQAQALATSLDESARADLSRAADRLSQLTASLAADPLSVAPGEVDRLNDSLEAIRRELEAAVALRGALDASLADSRALAAQLRAGVDEAHAAHEELLIKIAVPSAPAAPEPPDDLDDELEQIAELARSGAWRDARRRLDQWTTGARERLDEAERIVRANHAPIEARNQLRALLEAYQVKAGRLGAVEDPELERIYSQAHHALHTAPSDVALAAQLVRRYQEILTATQHAPEVIR